MFFGAIHFLPFLLVRTYWRVRVQSLHPTPVKSSVQLRVQMFPRTFAKIFGEVFAPAFVTMHAKAMIQILFPMSSLILTKMFVPIFVFTVG